MTQIESSLAPTFLVAMPQLQDPNFNKCVVLLCEHNDDGAMGLVVNRDTDTRASEIVDFDPPTESDSGLEVSIGGPVDPSRGWLILSEQHNDAVEIADGVYLSASSDLLRDMVEGTKPECRCRFLVGYAGWGPQQLDRELADSAWLTVPLNRDLLFEASTDEVWELAIRQLGIDPSSLAMGPGVSQ